MKMKLSKFLIFFLILLFPLGQLTRLPSLNFLQIHLYLQDLIIGVLIISWLTYHFLTKKPLPNPPLTKSLFLFSLIALLSLIVNLPRLTLQESIVSSLYLLRWIAYASLYFIIFEIIRANRRHIVISPVRRRAGQYLNLYYFFILAGALTAIFGLLQYLLYPNLRNLYYLGWDPHEKRIFGAFLDPNFTGIVLVLTLILITSLKFEKLSSLSNFLHLSWILTYLALMLTYSRSSYLAYVAGMFTIGLIRKSWKFFLSILILFSASLLLLPRSSSEGVKLERTSTVNARLKNYQQTLTIIKDHPLFGVGFNSLRYAKRDYSFLEEKDWQGTHSGAGADSSLLFVWVTTGFLGLTSYLFLWWKILTIETIEPLNHRTTSMILPISAALLSHSLFLNSLFYPWVMLWFWLILGISHAALNNRLISR